MELTDAILHRRSIRAFEDRPIAHEVLNGIFEKAMMAPSWKNTQTAGYVVVESEEMLKKLVDTMPEINVRTTSGAAAIVVMTAKKYRSGYNRDGSFSTNKGDSWEMFDGGIACQTFCLAAYEAGLGTCILGLYDEEAITALLGLGEDTRVTALIAVGYPAQEPHAPKRKTVEEKVRYV